ncbi:MAG: cytochrome b N-terminal domain-containing protein, partial [Alphaproteobacteria bacterium]
MVRKLILKNGFEWLEHGFDRAFGAAWNPLYQLGALGFFFYWVVVVTGVYLYVVFETSVVGAYQSVEYMTHVQWYAGGVMRSLHRYASDALVVVMMVHLVREFALDRYRGARWWSWFTGVPILWFVFACGISGYWLVWDTLAQYIAIATTEWFDVLGIFGEPIARNFLNQPALDGRFFTLMVFIHILVPLFLLFVMWLHLQRTARARWNPPRGLALGSLVMLTALSFIYPAESQAPANLDVVPTLVRPDWFYLAGYPLADQVPGELMWAAAAVITLVLASLPWLPRQRPAPVAAVDLENCNGCTRCVADCPFNAITMTARSDGRPFEQEATVDPALCVSCGICIGSCPTATPFRRLSGLKAGIELPGLPVSALREQTLEAAKKLTGDARVIVFGCTHCADLDALQGDGVATVALPCTGMLPPAFIDFIVSGGHADGVFLTGCREGDCHHRLGIDWMEQRIEGARDPYLRKRVPAERICRAWT